MINDSLIDEIIDEQTKQHIIGLLGEWITKQSDFRNLVIERLDALSDCIEQLQDTVYGDEDVGC